jgi:hypothetical protein
MAYDWKWLVAVKAALVAIAVSMITIFAGIGR